MRRRDPGADALLGRPLEVHVERQANRLTRLLLLLRDQPASGAPEGVDTQLGEPVLAAKVSVVARLDATLADLVAQQVALAAEMRVLRGRDQAHSAEQLGGE